MPIRSGPPSRATCAPRTIRVAAAGGGEAGVLIPTAHPSLPRSTSDDRHYGSAWGAAGQAEPLLWSGRLVTNVTRQRKGVPVGPHAPTRHRPYACHAGVRVMSRETGMLTGGSVAPAKVVSSSRIAELTAEARYHRGVIDMHFDPVLACMNRFGDADPVRRVPERADPLTVDENDRRFADRWIEEGSHTGGIGRPGVGGGGSCAEVEEEGRSVVGVYRSEERRVGKERRSR